MIKFTNIPRQQLPRRQKSENSRYHFPMSKQTYHGSLSTPHRVWFKFAQRIMESGERKYRMYRQNRWKPQTGNGNFTYSRGSKRPLIDKIRVPRKEVNACSRQQTTSSKFENSSFSANTMPIHLQANSDLETTYPQKAEE